MASNNNRLETGTITIDLCKDGIRANGNLLTDMTVAALTSVLGVPRIVHYGDKPYVRAIWDEAGVFADTPDTIIVTEIGLRLAEDTELENRAKYDFAERHPKEVFLGKFTINGMPPLDGISEETLRKAYLWIETKIGHWELVLRFISAISDPLKAMPFPERLHKMDTGAIADIVRSTSEPFSEVYISYKSPKVSTGKWKLPKPTFEVISLSHLPFKLAIIEELMYNQERLSPKFDVYDFAQDYIKREIDPDEYYFEMIPEVRNWFRDLPIPLSLAEHVERLYFDGGNEIYLQIIPQWDGEGDQFDVKVLMEQELMQFPNLHRVDGAGWLAPDVRSMLISRGIEVFD